MKRVASTKDKTGILHTNLTSLAQVASLDPENRSNTRSSSKIKDSSLLTSAIHLIYGPKKQLVEQKLLRQPPKPPESATKRMNESLQNSYASLSKRTSPQKKGLQQALK